MAELRLICDREIPIQQQRIDTSCGSFRNSLQSAKSKVEQTLELQGIIFMYFSFFSFLGSNPSSVFWTGTRVFFLSFFFLFFSGRNALKLFDS